MERTRSAIFRVTQLLVRLLLASTLVLNVEVSAIDCGFLPHCSSCITKRAGTVTRLFCTACSVGYVVAPDQRSCFCAPGFYWNETGGTCQPCGVGAWCPGGIADSKGARTLCGANMTTTTSRARYANQCVPQPGAGLLADNVNAAACDVGSYSYGYARKPCVPCPRTFTTPGTGASSKWKCATPPGYRYADEQAAPCGFGYWKSGVDFSVACTACGTGLTTPTAASASAAECVLAKPGYYLDKTGSTVNGALPCSVGSYSAGGDVTACTGCPAGETTYKTLASSADECMAMPGYGYNSTSGSAYPCPIGSYKYSLGPQDCSSCGEGLTTNRTAATSYQDCYIPVGWGATLLSYDPLTLKAIRCIAGTWGVASPVFGARSSDLACRKCPQYTTTLDTWTAGLTQQQRDTVVNDGATDCLAVPGYGISADNGTAYLCPAGTYSLGYHREPCSSCPDGYTSAAGSTTCTTTCVIADTNCTLPAGWGATVVNGTVTKTVTATKCAGGSYGTSGVADVAVDTPCSACPGNTTTPDTNPSVTSSARVAVVNDASSDCVNLPGYGYDSGTFTVYQCPVGDYSPGYTMDVCGHCTPGQTSPAGSDSALDCY